MFLRTVMHLCLIQHHLGGAVSEQSTVPVLHDGRYCIYDSHYLDAEEMVTVELGLSFLGFKHGSF